MKIFMRICMLINVLGIIMGLLNNNIKSIIACGFCGVMLAIVSNDCDNV